MGEYIVLFEPGEVELGPRGKEGKRCRRKGFPALAGEHLIKLFLDGMQVKDVICRISHLAVGQLGGTPIAALLLFGQLNPQKLAGKVLEAMTIRVGADELRRDLRAVDRARLDPEVLLEHGDVEAREMENLQDLADRSGEL